MQQWIDHGFLRPSISPPRGSGKNNRYSLQDVYRIATFAKLMQVGILRRTVAYLIASIDSQKVREGFRFYVVSPGVPSPGPDRISWVGHMGDKIEPPSEDFQTVIDVAKIKKEVDEKLHI